MKSRLIRVAVLLCVAILFVSVIDRAQVVARSRRPTAAIRQQTLVKQINQVARRFYTAFIRQSIRTATVDCELNELLEDFLLAVDGLVDPRYTRHNLVFVMQIASDIEQELLRGNTSSEMAMAWSRLLADLNRLAKMNGIKQSEAVITTDFIAALAGDVEPASRKVLSEHSSGNARLGESRKSLGQSYAAHQIYKALV